MQVVKRACAYLDESLARFNYDPYDIKAIFHPANFVMFDGLNSGEELKEISFLAKAKKGDEVLRSLEEAIGEKRCNMKIARVSEDGRVKFES